jgi:hypothetical protein
MVTSNSWISNILMAVTSRGGWYQKIDGTEKPLVQGNGWYKCVIGTKTLLVPRDCSCYKITGANNLSVPEK